MVGIGPGAPEERTRRAEQAIRESSVLVGYEPYLDLLRDLISGHELISSGMTQEIERCRAAVARAEKGAVVSLVSSGDAGVYGMAGLALGLAAAEGLRIPIEIVPGVSAAHAAAARLGAPLALDYASISLSDLLVPWETIRQRLEAVAAADLVTALYNPKSTKRIHQIEEAAVIFRRHRPDETPVGLATAVSSAEERIALSTLGRFLDEEITMRTVVIIGNRSSQSLNGWFVTPRGYAL
ncbi:MAG TPA: precorrin-3B C(17)-methyltransferase [Alphaproteobacteria bacterium]|nr:precorrin-3B C(17)-methyltransferase [Alphaproteobacteria bacterium]